MLCMQVILLSSHADMKQVVKCPEPEFRNSNVHTYFGEKIRQECDTYIWPQRTYFYPYRHLFNVNFRSRRWGSSPTVCARLTVRSSPHRNERKFFGARVCRVTFKHLPQPIRSHILSFGTLGQLFKIPPFSAQKSHSAGGRGVPEIFFGLES